MRCLDSPKAIIHLKIKELLNNVGWFTQNLCFTFHLTEKLRNQNKTKRTYFSYSFEAKVLEAN